MIAFRIALKRYGQTAQEAFSGKSGMAVDGRWHTAGRLLDYAAESRSLATLERLVHYERFDCLQEHIIYRLEIPNAEVVSLSPLPEDWDHKNSPQAQAAGNRWYDNAESAVLGVPSVVSAGEINFLINARHPRWDWKWVTGSARFEFNKRIVSLIQKATSSR